MAFPGSKARLAETRLAIRPMVDLSAEMAELSNRLGLAGDARSRGAFRPAHVLQFVAADPGEGVSTVAREFARHVAPGARRGVWLVELDLLSGRQFDAVAAAPELYGELGDAVKASPDGSAFFSVRPRLKGVGGQSWVDERYLDAHPVGRWRWWVTRFRREALRPGQTVSILNTPQYWNALRAYADYVIIDAPALARSQVALATAAQADANILVVAADGGSARAPLAARDALVGAGGYCAGLVYNRAAAEPPEFLRALLP